MKRLWLAMLALGTAALAASPAAAQSGRTDGDDGRGLVVGVDLNATRVASGGADRGGGAGLTLGYGVTPSLSLFARGNVAYLSSHLDLGARYGFGAPGARVRPYVEAALSRVGSSGAGERVSGYGATGGVGIEYRLARALALDLGVSSTVGQFERPDLPVADFTSTRLNVGVRWRP